ncbi:F-box/kelch-repeat protein [Camellia lanceoleosa]|uniref:F-box/kelch-repeat protein n=1 Tax=Camellia lanceoleosa TaxID=1840588 RepID=A0ACC0FA45_9ERIC|nr:F-box/kelch-repeat protein [Camellia lanceoleosa]
MFNNSDGVLDLPIRMGCISVGSKLYMIGDVYALDFDRRGCASIRVCKNGGGDDIPRMLVPKFSPLVINLDEKIYVVARRPSCKYDKPLELPVFKVFDPLLKSWKALPHPPWTDPAQFKIGSDYMHHHFVWAHKIVCCTILVSSFLTLVWRNGSSLKSAYPLSL